MRAVTELEWLGSKKGNACLHNKPSTLSLDPRLRKLNDTEIIQTANQCAQRMLMNRKTNPEDRETEQVAPASLQGDSGISHFYMVVL